jgi:prepilin signal peptidase PulO-like enzyme (type II secretory pathway)
MCPTPIGRIHTRVATLVIPAILATIISVITGEAGWIVLIGVYLLMGVALDAGVYSWLIRYQPPWMTGILGLVELGLLFVLANILELGLSAAEAIIFYVVVWCIAIATKIVILPIVSLTYLESSFEFRTTEWSIPPSQAAVPILAAPDEAEAGAGPVLRSASGAHAVPLEPKPSPSGVHRVPEELQR